MSIKYRDDIVIYLAVIIVSALIGILVRIKFIENGADEFTANMFFLISVGLGILLFAFIQIFINELYQIIKRKFFKSKKIETAISILNFNGNIEKIREGQESLKEIEKQNKIKTAVEYTQKQFALYMTVEDLEVLCGNIIVYAQAENFLDLKPVKTSDLVTQDIEHFGWNIHNHFNDRVQEKVVEFLKLVFSTDLKDVEIPSIKSHLKTAPDKGKIKLVHNLAKYCENN